jgi:hypothetical protein
MEYKQYMINILVQPNCYLVTTTSYHLLATTYLPNLTYYILT